MFSRRLTILAALTLFGAACSKSTTDSTTTGTGSGTAGTTGSSGASCPGPLTSLQLSPAQPSATIQNGEVAPISFTATARTASGTLNVNPAALTWTVTRADDTAPGTIANGVFTPFPGAGGTVTVTAAGCGASASATVTLSLQYQAQAGSDGGAGAGDFGGPVVANDTAHAPSIIYPSAQTRFPRNIYKVLFQWKKNGNGKFHLKFAGAASTVDIFTDGSHPTCSAVSSIGCWEADAATWNAIAGSNAGSTVTFQVDGTASAGATVYAGAPETLGFSRRDVRGAIFYWAADVGGIQRATVSDAAPENYLVGPQKVPATVLPNGDSVACAACHTVSRDGKKMAVTGSATGPVSMPKGLWTLAVTPTPPPTPLQTTYPSAAGDGFAAFSPDTSKLIWSPRNGGTLVLLDAASGSTISQVKIGGQTVFGLAPDWSPSTVRNDFVYQDATGGISLLTWDGSAFNGPKVLAPKIAGHNDAYPSYSPEGTWVAFTNNNTSLYLVPADGGSTIELHAANTMVNNATVAPSENSMPTWAPPGDLHWVAFNSQRPYGLVTSGGNNQLWVAAVDFSRLDGGDPSYPAFRLPFQDLTAKNHRAFWTEDVRDALDAGATDAGGINEGGYTYDAGACVATGQLCDPGSDVCCEQASNGAYCGSNGDGGNICQRPQFK